MSMLAEYKMIDDETLDMLMSYDNDFEEDLFDKIDEFDLSCSEEECYDTQFWDALCYLLEGMPFTPDIEKRGFYGTYSPVCGVDSFINSEGLDYHLKYIESGSVPKIIKIMESANFNKLKEDFDLKKFEKAGVYLFDYTKDMGKEETFDELISEYNSLLEFYKEAKKLEKGILVSIQ